MSNMVYTVAYVFLGLLLLGFEILAISSKKKGDTISEHIWHWRNAKNTTVRRILLAVAFTWLWIHFVIQG